LRLAEAKRLLLTSSLNVTDVCFRVGYNSLGSFTVRFSRSVGVSPGRFRQLRHPLGLRYFNDDDDPARKQQYTGSVCMASQLSGRVRANSALPGPVFIGLFKTPVPEGEPICCAVLAGPDTYRMLQVPEGTYYVLAASFPWPGKGPEPLLQDSESLQIGRYGPVRVAHDEVLRDVDLLLRPALPTDPPVLVALPALLARLHTPNRGKVRLSY
jgi:AraC family transcriptional regulator